MRLAARRKGTSSTTLLVVVASVLALTPARSAAQELSHALRARLARALTRSTVTIEGAGSQGSGFVVGSERWILTACHVVESAAEDSSAPLTVTFTGGVARRARVLARDPEHDLALLEIEGGHVRAPSLSLGDSDAVAVGHRVLALAEPQSTAAVVVTGTVIARSDIDIDAPPRARQLIWTDASIEPRVSGGPLADETGRVIGVRWAGLLGGRPLSFSIPAIHARDFLAHVESAYAAASAATGEPTDPTAPPPALFAAGLVVEDAAPRELSGVRVLHVVPGSSAARAGIAGGDAPIATGSAPWIAPVITAIDEHPIGSVAELEAYLASCARGQLVQLSLRRSLRVTAAAGTVSMVLGGP